MSCFKYSCSHDLMSSSVGLRLVKWLGWDSTGQNGRLGRKRKELLIKKRLVGCSVKLMLRNFFDSLPLKRKQAEKHV